MNRKSIKERAQILSLLVEGNSLRATTRIIREMQGGCSINTVTKLLEEVGEACAAYQDRHLVNLPCSRVQVDEIKQGLYVTWASVPAQYVDGVERYLHDRYDPIVAERVPDVLPVAVNLPG